MPVLKKSKFVAPIHREAREAAERAITALGDLHDADPYVFAALVETQWSYDGLPSGIREQMKIVRQRTHELKLRAVELATPPRIA